MALSASYSWCHLMRSVCRTVPVTYMGCQQQRTIVKLRRRYPPPIPKLDRKPHRTKNRHYVYVLEEDIVHNPKSKLQVILTDDVEGIGMKGDIVSVEKRIARSKLLRNNLAVYASPENIQELSMERKEKETEESKNVLTATAIKTIDFLKKNRLTVRMRPTPEWDVLPREAVIHAFNKHLGVVVADHALEMPEEPITDYGTYTIHVTVNKVETVPVEMDVEHYINKARSKRRAQVETEGTAV